MPSYIAIIVSKNRITKKNRKRQIEVFAGCVGDAENMVLPTLKRGEKIYDIGSKMRFGDRLISGYHTSELRK